VTNTFETDIRSDRSETLLWAEAGKGIVLWTGLFERSISSFSSLLFRTLGLDPDSVVYPPPIARKRVIKDSGYSTNFADLAGIIADLPEKIQTVHGDDSLCLPGAGCHPVFDCLAGKTIDKFTIIGTVTPVFRRESQRNCWRLLSFRQAEAVILGQEADVHTKLDEFAKSAHSLLTNLGLRVRLSAASDSFTGRGAALKGIFQRSSASKTEFLWTDAARMDHALLSTNRHWTTFGDRFNIRLNDGRTASTACIGVGLERVVLALNEVVGLSNICWEQYPSDRAGEG